MNLYDRLVQHEGVRLTVYDDATGKPIQPGSEVKGNPTIGIGTLLCSPGGITRDEADMLCKNRIAIAYAAVDALHVGLDEVDPRYEVLAEMAFQMGASGLAQFTNTLQAIRDKRWNDAAQGMLNSLWARQTPSRARELASVMALGE